MINGEQSQRFGMSFKNNKYKHMKSTLTILVMALMIMSCNSDKKSDSESTDSTLESAKSTEVTEIISIEQKQWKLKTLEGKDIAIVENQEKDMYFTLDRNENRVVGFSGCNTFNGTYSLEKGNRIRFTQMASTLKLCPDVDVNESEFLEVFELADNYTINGNELSLNVGRRAPLAVFEAVDVE